MIINNNAHNNNFELARLSGMRHSLILTIILILPGLCSCSPDRGDEQRTERNGRPNVLLIVADDLGYSDLGVFGGEINTPNLDALGRDGILLTQFYSAPTCSPTRSMLLSGTDNHLAGLGHMYEELRANQVGHPGYEGYLNYRVASLAEIMRDAGYHTYMTGKWHLGLTGETSPHARGFERSFDLAQGGAGHLGDLPLIGLNPSIYREDGKPVGLPDDFYSSRFYARKLIEYLKSNDEDGRPFFAYLAFTAPHWPLQAPKESVENYAGRYDSGWDVLQGRRFENLKKLGLIEQDAVPFDRLETEPAWQDLPDEEKQLEARKMEIFAAMVDDMDRHTGEVIDYLKSSGQFENTLIFFMSDNGAEGAHLNIGWEALEQWVEQCCDNSLENLGNGDSYTWYGPNWTWASSGGYRMYKQFTTEGGIRVPAIVHFPQQLQKGAAIDEFVTVKDVLPTILELTGIVHPGSSFNGREVLPLQGASMLSMLKGEQETTHNQDYVMGWELFGRRAIRKGDWKIVWEPAGIPWEPRETDIPVDKWRLYDIKEDPGELNDLSSNQPDKLKELVQEWEIYARENGVILPDYGAPYTTYTY